MNRFGVFIKSILMLEGVHSDIIDDRGGRTFFGISSRYNPEILTTDNKFQLALRIYRTKYYQNRNIDKIASDKLSFLLFDHMVNPTKEWGLEIQKQLNKISKVKVNTDGVIGKRTISTILSLNKGDQDLLADMVVKKLPSMKISYYNRNKDRTYVRGVLNRFSMRALLVSQGGSDISIDKANSFSDLAKAHSLVYSKAIKGEINA